MKGGRIALKQANWQNTIKHLEEMLTTMKFGSITLVVQDGKIVQIEKNEKIRLP
ncbi:hypothetical protein J27TS8_18750 [Robertmurraya siralis]|uniref:DUF2292 domain-containing protein n=1 Tax=Robertmurraya siralis TaxID=77777 RepID=A0A920BU32_9BACI|nr:YezD family protein [Robertmurraya siralis]PAE19135.1 hypothetical protein CHH80_18055 [Bacillus sp. 7504-2]GIN61882.1 hypothetical protein J27TS8_18750 [Robertmurraya siralis]